MTNNTTPQIEILPWTPPTPAPAGYADEAEVIRHLIEDEGYTPTEAVEMINAVYAAWGARILLTFEQWEHEIMAQVHA